MNHIYLAPKRKISYLFWKTNCRTQLKKENLFS